MTLVQNENQGIRHSTAKKVIDPDAEESQDLTLVLHSVSVIENM